MGGIRASKPSDHSVESNSLTYSEGTKSFNLHDSAFVVSRLFLSMP